MIEPAQTSNADLKILREKMLELIKLRAQLLSGNLPVDEMKDIKLKAASEIDTGNKLLGRHSVCIYYKSNYWVRSQTHNTQIFIGGSIKSNLNV